MLTVFRARGKTDYGVVGFEDSPEKTEQYLVFPKSLRRFDGARVVGVKFDLVEQPKLTSVDRRAWAAAHPRSRKKKATPAKSTANVLPFVRHEPEQTDEPLASAASEPKAPRRAPPQKQKRTDPSAPEKPESEANSSARPAPIGDDKRYTALAREVKAALKELQRGKAVAAYQRLQHALEK